MAYINDTLPADNRPRPAECDITEIVEDEDTIYAKAFQKCLTELANEVYGNTDPFDIAQRVLRAACDFYDADWCGMFDADMMLDLWMPFWWYKYTCFSRLISRSVSLLYGIIFSSTEESIPARVFFIFGIRKKWGESYERNTKAP